MASPSFEDILPSGDDTLLTISGLGNFQYQARGLTQTLFVIKQTQQQVRDVNGILVDVSNPAFRKYGSKITCTDVDATPIDGLWPGMEVVVGCTCELAYPTGNSGSPYRAVVSGSSYVQGAYTFYRPELNMMILDIQRTFDEWKHDNGWEIDLEEI